MSFQIGDVLGTYKIVATLGSGGMGEVFQAEHLVTKRVEAMKILPADSASTPERDQRFLREIRLQARLSHPNIASVHNAFWQDGHLIMIMELIEGDSLRTLLERRRLPLPVAIEYACQALRALDYAHARGVVHRDVSPSNIIITEDGTLKLTDFGLAKSQADVRITQSGTIIGSLYYTSPEQVQGHDRIDIRADIYSLGALLFEMVTGVKLFDCDKPFSLMQAHVEQPPARASEVDSSLPPELDEILLKALDKDRDKRFQSAEVFRWALENVKDAESEERTAVVPMARPHPLSQAVLQQAAPAGTNPESNRRPRNRRASAGEHRGHGFRRRLTGARSYRNRGAYRTWATQLHHLADHLAERPDAVPRGQLPGPAETIIADHIDDGTAAEIFNQPDDD